MILGSNVLENAEIETMFRGIRARQRSKGREGVLTRLAP